MLSGEGGVIMCIRPSQACVTGARQRPLPEPLHREIAHLIKRTGAAQVQGKRAAAG
jgi:hypothetical protein